MDEEGPILNHTAIEVEEVVSVIEVVDDFQSPVLASEEEEVVQHPEIEVDVRTKEVLDEFQSPVRASGEEEYVERPLGVDDTDTDVRTNAYDTNEVEDVEEEEDEVASVDDQDTEVTSEDDQDTVEDLGYSTPVKVRVVLFLFYSTYF